jgi:NAD-dependent DNA ligase
MESSLDIKQQIDDKYRNEFIEMVQGNTEPKRGKKVTIRKTKKRDLSKDEIEENFTPPVEAESDKPMLTGRLNEKLIDLVDTLGNMMAKKGEPFRSRAYKKAQESLIVYPDEINETNYQNLVSLPGVGETIIKKFKEYITTGTLRVIEREKNDPRNIFSDIYGVGPKKAAEIVDKYSITTLDDLRKQQDNVLNEKQKVGLKYYEDILKRIPRSEVIEFDKILTESFDLVKTSDARFEIVGSYRRGAKNSGDIDVIITAEDRTVFVNFVDKLVEKEIITHDGLLSRGSTKSLVVAKLPGSNTARRVDFMYTSKSEYPFAVLYFTGSKFFNTVMRGRALTMGYTLNEHGFHTMDGKKKGPKFDRVFADEQDIFKFLKMVYKEPHERVDGRSVIPMTGSPQIKMPQEVKILETVKIPTPKNESAKKKTKNLTRKINKEERERLKNEEKMRKIAAKEAAEKEKEEVKAMKLREKEAEKTRKKKEKETEKTRKNREKDEKKIKKNKTIKHKSPSISKMVKSNKSCPICKKPPLTKDAVLHMIEHYKTGGLSVLESINEKTLNDMLIKTNDVYRNLGPDEQPLISDNQYDILEDYIKEKFPKNTVVGKIGAPVGKHKVNLPYEMASMDKIKPDTKALPSWKAKYKGPYVLSCKLDGVSGLYTTEGEKSALYTRGDGKVGQNVTHFISYLKLPTTKDIVVRGEFIMKKSTFKSKYADKFANPRNLIAGTVNRVTINDTVNDMDFIAYELIKPELKPSEQMRKLEELGFNTVQNESLTEINNDELSERLVSWRENYEYEIDGVIVTNDKIYKRQSGNPDHSFAFKMVLSDQMAETKVLDVIWAASKDGYLKPRVRLEPVHLGGVKIEYATGFNGSFIETNKIGVGAVIKLIRSGDVIPKIQSIVTPAEQPLMPTVEYVWNSTHVDIMLKNKDEDKNVRNKNITLFFKGIDVDGLGDKNVEKIIDAGFDTIPKIIKMNKEQLLSVDGFKERMAVKIHDGIKDKVDKAPLTRIMGVSNMFGRGFSSKKTELVLQEYPDILTSQETPEQKITKLKSVKGMALTTSKSFVENIPAFLEFLQECGLTDKLRSVPSNPISEKDETHPLFKKIIVMSGSRDKELEKLLEKSGASMSSSVNKTTFAVITPEPDSTTGKVATAKKLGTPIYTPEQFKYRFLKE